MMQLSQIFRLFVNSSLHKEACIDLSSIQKHYVLNVMRLKSGNRVSLFNGCDGEWGGVLESKNKKNCSVTVITQIRCQINEPGPWLAFSPIKKTRTNFIVEKATELGAEYICPVFTKNTNSTRIKISRMRMLAIGASEQCRRLTVPNIASPKSLEEFIKWWPKERRLFVLDESGAGQPIIKALGDLRSGVNSLFKECGFLIGPEGGFDAEEMEALRNLDFVFGLDLGPRILRSETAALSAIACWQAFVGSNN
jgi:16S rRNA (uracil1498-N3)-methyltransferase